MISASAADAHRFGRVRRNGYDPAEVDAVVSRLVDMLRTYEDRIHGLEERLTEADASADAIRRTFVAAEKTRDEILEAARAQSQSITDGARSEAEEILAVARTAAAESTERAETEVAELTELAERLEADMADTRKRILDEAEQEAAGVLAEAESEAAVAMTAALEQARAESETTIAEAFTQRRTAELVARAAATAAAWTRREALMNARSIVAEAEERAALLVADAERERAALTERAEHLRHAIATLQASAAQLAALANSQASIIDLSEVESLERAELDLSDVDLRAIERAEEHLQAIKDADGPRDEFDEDEDAEPVHEARDEATEPDGADTSGDPEATERVAPEIAADGGPLPEPRRLLTVAEAAEEIARADTAEGHEDATGPTEGADADADDAPERPTYYQRSTGIPLSERVKLARRSG